MKLILIHGRAQQGKDPVVLQRTWEDALAHYMTRRTTAA